MSNSEQLNIDITAKDAASKVVDGLQTKVDKLDKSDPEIDVNADTRGADSDLDALDEQLDKLTNRDKLVVLALRAGAVQTELRDVASQLATIDASDPTIDATFTSYRELSGQLDDIEGKMKAIGDADPDAGKNLAGARDRLREVGDESGKAQGAIHGMAGNAAGDFAATTAGIGPLGEAIGQLTEGALSGEIAMKGMATAGLGMGAIAGGIMLVNKIMGEFAKTAERTAKLKAFDAEQVKLYTDALREGKSAAEALADKITAAGEATFITRSSLDSFGEGFRTQNDLADEFARAGVSITQFATAITNGRPAVDQLEEAMRLAGVAGDDITAIISAARHESESYAEAQEKNARITKLLTDETAEANAAFGKGAAAMGAAAVKAAGLGGAARQTARDFDHLDAAYRGLTDQFSDESAWLDLKDQIDTTAQAAWDAAAATENQAGAARDARQAQLDLIESVSQYAKEVLGLPPQQVTEIVAAVNRGDLAEADRLLDEATRTRTAWIDVQVKALTGALTGALTSIQGSGGRPVPGTTTINNFGAGTGGALPSLSAAAAPARWARINGRG